MNPIITQLEDEVKAAHATAKQKLNNLTTGVTACDRTQEEQRLAAAALRAAEATRLQAQGEVTAAKAACDKFEDESREMTDALAQRQADLEAFTTWNVACFETLRDKQAPRKVEPET